MVLGYLVLLLLPIVAIGYIVWDYRRKTAQHEIASASRLQELVGVAPPGGSAGPVAAPASTAHAMPPSARPPSTAPTSPAPPSKPEAAAAAPPFGTGALSGTGAPPAAPPSTTEAPPAAPHYTARERLLTPPQTLAYFLLRTGLPDCLVFARVTLAAVLDAAPGVPHDARDEQIRRLGGHTVDFVVSDRSMKPIVVVKLNLPERENASTDEIEPARTWLAMAGVRYVELNAAALPKKDAIRGLVLGDSAPSESGEKTAQNAR